MVGIRVHGIFCTSPGALGGSWVSCLAYPLALHPIVALAFQLRGADSYGTLAGAPGASMPQLQLLGLDLIALV